jgi:hypothetical protein
MKEEMKIDHKRYEIAYLYIKEFVHKDFPIGERFNYEPIPGKVYRALKDMKARPPTYRIVLSAKEGRDSVGIVFDKLKDVNNAWEHEIIEIDFENMASIKMDDEEVKKVMNWMNDKKGEKEFVEWCLTPEKPEEEEYIEMEVEVENDLDEYRGVLKGIINNFHRIAAGGDGVADVMVDILYYLRTTYSDKYEDEDSPIRAKKFCYSSKHGKGINMFCSSKYIQRYLTDDYDKSDNPKDILKAIHYLIYELARVKIENLKKYVENQRAIDNGDAKRAEETDKKPKRRGRPPKQAPKG